MPKRIGIVLVVLALLAVPAFAQDTPLPAENGWTISLYDQSTGTVTRTAPGGGVISEFVLPIPETFDTHSWYIDTAPFGNFIAYVVSQVGDGSSAAQPSQLIVYDVVNQSMAINYNLNEAITQEGVNAAASSLAFNDAGTFVVTSYYVRADESGSTYTMELTALDLTTGQVMNTVGNDALAAAGANAGSAYHVEPLAFLNNVVTLRLSPVFVDEQMQPLVLNWDVTTNELSAAPPELVNARDYFPPSAEALLLDGSAIQIINLTSGDLQTISTPEGSLSDARFIQNGERILVFAETGAQVVERNGMVVQELTDLPQSQYVSGTPDGFVYGDPESAAGITSVTTRDNSFASSIAFAPAAPYTSVSVQQYPSVPATPADDPNSALSGEG